MLRTLGVALFALFYSRFTGRGAKRRRARKAHQQ